MEEEILTAADDSEDVEGAPGESKSEKFQRLAGYRVNKILSGIQSLEKLSNTSSYEYTPEMVEKMFEAMETALTEAKAKFSKVKDKKTTFTF